MKYHEFNALAELERADTAWQQGVFLMERKEAFHRMLLYQLEDYYIEVVYHTHFNVVLKVGTFKDPELLNPYLSRVALPKFFV